MQTVTSADGTTIAYVPSATIVQRLTMPSVPFDPLTDIAPIQSIAQMVLGDLGTADLLVPVGASPHD